MSRAAMAFPGCAPPELQPRINPIHVAAHIHAGLWRENFADLRF
jgi:hypothetical protein